eukprot:Gb_37476 [translate_table: standard]
MAGQLRSYAARILQVLLFLLSVSDLVLQSNAADQFQVQEFNGEKLSRNGFRVDLVHRDSPFSPIGPGNITSTERLQRAVKRSQERLQKLMKMSAISNSIEAPVNIGDGEYLMKLEIGTPPLSFSGILDTGSDLTWTQCQPCSDCYEQPTPIYDPSKSSTFSNAPCESSVCQALPLSSCNNRVCEYGYYYGDYSVTEGILSFETFTFSSRQSFPHLAFGCGRRNEGGGFNQGGGIIGLGRSILSLVGQLGSTAANKFSYCLMPINDSPTKTSALIFGEDAQLSGDSVRSTPIIQNEQQPIFYYISLEDISIGGKLLNIPQGTFDIQSDGSGGVVIDSGTTVTYLEEAGYNLVKKTLSSLINLTKVDGYGTGLDLCFKRPSAKSNPSFPTMTFHFKGADYDLPVANYMVLFLRRGLFCVTMLPNSGDVSPWHTNISIAILFYHGALVNLAVECKEIKDPLMAKEAMDFGPQGLMFSMIDESKVTKKVVSYFMYPPKGIKGACHLTIRASQYEINDKYLETYEDESLITCQVESKDAVKRIDDIAFIDGIDYIQMDSTDMSASINYLSNSNHHFFTNGEQLYGVFLLTFSPVVDGIVGYAGYDYTVVDMEHAPRDTMAALPMLQALPPTNTIAILQILDNDPMMLLLLMGLIVFSLTDMSASMGYLLNPSHKKANEIFKRAEKSVLGVKNGPYLAGFALPNDPPADLQKRGYHMVSGALDIGFLKNAALEDQLDAFGELEGVAGGVAGTQLKPGFVGCTTVLGRRIAMKKSPRRICLLCLLGLISMLIISVHSKLAIIFVVLLLTTATSGVVIADVTIDACIAKNSIHYPVLVEDM